MCHKIIIKYQNTPREAAYGRLSTGYISQNDTWSHILPRSNWQNSCGYPDKNPSFSLPLPTDTTGSPSERNWIFPTAVTTGDWSLTARALLLFFYNQSIIEEQVKKSKNFENQTTQPSGCQADSKNVRRVGHELAQCHFVISQILRPIVIKPIPDPIKLAAAWIIGWGVEW